MAGRYLESYFTPEVLAAQVHYYGRFQKIPPQAERDPLGNEEASFNWNCPQHITPRFTEKEVRDAVAPLKRRIAELEATLKPRT